MPSIILILPHGTLHPGSLVAMGTWACVRSAAAASRTPSAGSGWTLRTAPGVNNAGQIVGYGSHNGKQRALLLDPM